MLLMSYVSYSVASLAARTDSRGHLDGSEKRERRDANSEIRRESSVGRGRVNRHSRKGCRERSPCSELGCRR